MKRWPIEFLLVAVIVIILAIGWYFDIDVRPARFKGLTS